MELDLPELRSAQGMRPTSLVRRGGLRGGFDRFNKAFGFDKGFLTVLKGCYVVCTDKSLKRVLACLGFRA